MNYKKARGYLTQKEREYLYKLAKEASTIINVGVEYGASIHCFVEGSKPHTKIIAIDLIGSDKFEGMLNCAIEHESEYNIATHHNNGFDLINTVFDMHNEKTVLFIKGNSNTIPIAQTSGLIFIDGCHWGDCVQNDIEKYSQLATKYLLFHDYSDSQIHAGVKSALDNWNCNGFQKIAQIDTIAAYKKVN